jgi:hypothetical protein
MPCRCPDPPGATAVHCALCCALCCVFFLTADDYDLHISADDAEPCRRPAAIGLVSYTLPGFPRVLWGAPRPARRGGRNRAVDGLI